MYSFSLDLFGFVFSIGIFTGILHAKSPQIILTCRGFGVGKILIHAQKNRKGFGKEKHNLLVLEGCATVKLIMGCLVDSK